MPSSSVSPDISRRGSSRQACQPCSQRKVRCDKAGVQPCSNCLRRNQPELCDMGSRLRSRAQPHRASQPASKTLSLKRRTASTASDANESVGSAMQNNILPTSPTRSQRLSPSGSARSGMTITDHNQIPSASQDTPAPQHIGESAMATFIRHQADSTGYRLTDSLTSMLKLQNLGSGYPLLDLGASKDGWKELEPILPSPFEIWRLAVAAKRVAQNSRIPEAFQLSATASVFSLP